MCICAGYNVQNAHCVDPYTLTVLVDTISIIEMVNILFVCILFIFIRTKTRHRRTSNWKKAERRQDPSIENQQQNATIFKSNQRDIVELIL